MKTLITDGLFTRSGRYVGRLMISAALLLLATGVLLGVVGTIGYARAFEIGTHGTAGIFCAVVISLFVALVFLTAFRLTRRIEPIQPKYFIPALFFSGLVIHLLLVWLVKPQWGTDYLRYWEYAKKLVDTNQYGGLNAPYYSRALFFPYPVARIFGPNAVLALKIVNCIDFAIIQIMAYDIMRRMRSHQTAQGASLLLISAPIPALAILVPSHDLWGLFFMTFSLWAFSYALFANERRTFSIRIAAAVAAGVFSYLSEVQRSLGLVLCAATALASLLFALLPHNETTTRAGSRRLVIFTMILLGSYFACVRIDNHTKLRSESRPALTGMKMAANASGMGNGKSDWFARYRERFSEGYTSQERITDLAISSGLSSWAIAPSDRAEALATHATRLYSTTYPRDWDWLLRKPERLPDGIKDALIFYCDAFGIAFSLLLLIGTLRLASSTQTPTLLTISGAIFIVALSLPLLLVFETKPYNIFPLWLVGVQVIAEAADMRASQAKDRRYSLNPALAGLGAIIIFASVTVLMTRVFYTTANGRFFSNWTISAKTGGGNVIRDSSWRKSMIDASPHAFDAKVLASTDLPRSYLQGSDNDGKRIQKYAGSVVTRMQFPSHSTRGDAVDLSTQVCTGSGGRDELELFLYSPAMERAKVVRSEFSVVIDGRASNSIQIPLRGKDFQRLVVHDGFKPSACHQVVFRLMTVGLTKSEKDPFIEIWQPRLIRE